ncbi:hypothetical protein Tco_0652828 [Tanacetum coccineum]|uniref:Uncharacterized protein n=1 Tax=Tanacetum coccineum TaxID=301880 RepID=A0ABQ4WYQ9_9ASTR
MYDSCSPYGKCLRLHRRLLAAAEAVEGCCEVYHKGCRLLQRLNDIVKAATEVVGCCGGCHISSRLQRSLLALVEAAIYVDAVVKAATLLRRLQRCKEGYNVAKKAATLLRSVNIGYGLDLLLNTNPNRGSYEGPTDGATDYSTMGTTRL